MKTGNPRVGKQAAQGELKKMKKFQKMNRWSQNKEFQYEEKPRQTAKMAGESTVIAEKGAN